MNWTEKAPDAIRAAVKDSPDAVRLPALAAASVFEDNSETIASRSSAAFKLVLGYLHGGDEERARLAWIATGATFEQRQEALLLAHQAVGQDAADKQAAWEDAKAIGLQVIIAAGKVALPLIIAAI